VNVRLITLLAIPVAAAVAVAMLAAFAPGYLLHQGFPLDDAWIHAVYARELARTGMLAYNPGIPATGETSPLWALALAPLHAIIADPRSVVAATKIFGFILYALSALCVANAIARYSQTAVPAAFLGGALAVMHPDLAAASVSGMEVPLASLTIAFALYAAFRQQPLWLIAAAAATTMSRPETAVIAASFPLFLWARERPMAGGRLAVLAVFGSALAVGLSGFRNWSVSGLFLPATFHAKVGGGRVFDLSAQQAGFEGLLGWFPIVDSIGVLIAAAVGSIVLLWRASTPSAARAASAMYLSGMLFCATSFALIRPVDPAAFYHQRYVLPGVILMIVALPILALELLGRLPRASVLPARVAALALGFALVLQASPARYHRLSNDARNVDDVQVAFGSALATASPSERAWVVDAGASRFFGKAFVVDMIGLNTPDVLRPDAQAYLDTQSPRYLDLFQGWSTVEASERFPQRPFEASTPYTVTSYRRMRRHVLVTCEPAGAMGVMTVRGRSFGFRCASSGDGK
jgi:hypothetical protein